MYRDKTFLAIIPARSGSKRVKDKNIKDLCGKPLMAWSIESGLNSKYIDEVVVSTDSKQYADIAKSYGASVPFLRPQELSSDTSTTFDSIKHTIDFYKNTLNKEFDYIVLLQPTSPLRTSQHICDAIESIFKNDADCVVSVCECEHSPLWCNTLPQNLRMDNFLNEDIKNMRSQDLPLYYRLNGVVSVGSVNALMESKSFFTENTYAFVMPQNVSIDIDTDLDFLIAKSLLGGGVI